MSLTMAFSLVACGNSDASANAGTDTTATSAAATTTEAAQQTAPAEKQDVSLRMWGAEEDQPMLLSMIDSFKDITQIMQTSISSLVPSPNPQLRILF